MATTERLSNTTITTPEPAPSASHNPHVVALLVTAGLAWVLAFLLWNILGQVTDYTTYDLGAANALTSWITTLFLSGVVALVGAAVIAGVRREIHKFASPAL